MNFIESIGFDLNTPDDESLSLYFNKKSKKEQFVKQLACTLNKMLESEKEMHNNRRSPTTGLQE